MKKEKFVIKDILTNKKKLDRRYYLVQRFKQFLAAFVLGSILGALFGCYLADGGSISIGSPKALEQPVEVKAVENTHTPKISWNDAIREVFPKDEAGKMIRICMTENKSQNPDAKNYNTNGTVDASWCQVNSVHKPKNMSIDEWLENLTDPRFHAKEVRKIYLSQGWGAWVVYNRGLVR